MPLKEMFLSYVERQRTADEYRLNLGTDDERTRAAYILANDAKRNVLKEIDRYENPPRNREPVQERYYDYMLRKSREIMESDEITSNLNG